MAVIRFFASMTALTLRTVFAAPATVGHISCYGECRLDRLFCISRHGEDHGCSAEYCEQAFHVNSLQNPIYYIGLNGDCLSMLLALVGQCFSIFCHILNSGSHIERLLSQAADVKCKLYNDRFAARADLLFLMMQNVRC